MMNVINVKTVSLLIFSLFLTVPCLAQMKTSSGLTVCFAGEGVPLAQLEMNQEEWMYTNLLYYGDAEFMQTAPRCESLRKINFGINTVILFMSVGSAISSVTGAGIPVSLTLGLGTAGLGYLSFIISDMDCEDDRDAFHEKVREAVCEVLSQETSISCGDGKFEIMDAEPIAPVCKANGIYL